MSTVQSRSEGSIVRQVEAIRDKVPSFTSAGGEWGDRHRETGPGTAQAYPSLGLISVGQARSWLSKKDRWRQDSSGRLIREPVPARWKTHSRCL